MQGGTSVQSLIIRKPVLKKYMSSLMCSTLTMPCCSFHLRLSHREPCCDGPSAAITFCSAETNGLAAPLQRGSASGSCSDSTRKLEGWPNMSQGNCCISLGLWYSTDKSFIKEVQGWIRCSSPESSCTSAFLPSTPLVRVPSPTAQKGSASPLPAPSPSQLRLAFSCSAEVLPGKLPKSASGSARSDQTFLPTPPNGRPAHATKKVTHRHCISAGSLGNRCWAPSSKQRQHCL